MYPYRNSKQTRELTTDQGLPVDAVQSVPAGRYSGEQPVYRSVELGAPLSVLPQSLSQVEPRSGFIDFVSPAKAHLKAPALVVESAELQLPHVDSIFEPLSITRFEVSMAPAALLSQLQSLFEDNAVSILSFESANEMRCEKYCEKAVASAIFHVRLLSNGPGKVIVEFQCRSGCRSAFSNIYRLAKSQWHQCAPRRSLKALPLPKSTTSTTTSPEQWDSLLAWMQNDPSEALRAATCIASTGAAVCDEVMSQFVAHLADHRVDALEAITASIPSHRLQGFEDAIFSAVSEALSGSQIEERTACKLVAKVAAQIPELLSRDSCNFTSKLATAATASKWPCTREFAQTTLSILQPSAAVY